MGIRDKQVVAARGPAFYLGLLVGKPTNGKVSPSRRWIPGFKLGIGDDGCYFIDGAVTYMSRFCQETESVIISAAPQAAKDMIADRLAVAGLTGKELNALITRKDGQPEFKAYLRPCGLMYKCTTEKKAPWTLLTKDGELQYSYEHAYKFLGGKPQQQEG